MEAGRTVLQRTIFWYRAKRKKWNVNFRDLTDRVVVAGMVVDGGVAGRRGEARGSTVSGRLHVMITERGTDQWMVESPQIPGLLMSCTSWTEISHALVPHQSGWDSVVLHSVRTFRIPGGVGYQIRVAADAAQPERVRVFTRLAQVLAEESPETIANLAHPGRMEAVFVCAVPADTVGWCQEQLDQRGDTFTIATMDDESGVNTIQLTTQGGHQEWLTVSAHGWTERTTIAEVVRRLESTPWEQWGIVDG